MKCVIVVWMTLIVTQACSKSGASTTSAKWDATYNSQRSERGIPVLPSNWIQDPKFKGLNAQHWVPNTNIFATPQHRWKIIEYHVGIIDTEYDCFTSGETFIYKDADGRSERKDVAVIVSYDYEKERKGADPWSFNSITPDENGKPITRKEAQKLLESWHLPAGTIP